VGEQSERHVRAVEPGPELRRGLKGPGRTSNASTRASFTVLSATRPSLVSINAIRDDVRKASSTSSLLERRVICTDQ
jgi:hypothetical protein